MRTKPHRTLTTLGLVVLRLLQERPRHPYEVQQLIRDRSIDLVIKVRAGSLYHTFERLHRLSLIEPVQTGREGRRPERTVFAITESGRDEYRDNLRDLLRYPEEEYPVFVAAVEMMRTLDRAEVVRLLHQRVTALEAALAAREQVIASLSKRGLSRMSTIEVELTQALYRSELIWVGQLIDDIESGALPWRDEHAETKGAP